MIELLISAALIAFIVWQINQMPPLTKFAVAGGVDDFDFNPPGPDEAPEWEKNLMFKKGSAAPAQDPRIGQAAVANVKLGREWLALAEEQFQSENVRQREIDQTSNKMRELGLATAEDAREWSLEDRKRWEEKILPVEDKFIEKAATWDTEARREGEAGKAAADVMKASDIQRQIRRRNLSRMGIDPRSGRYAGIERSADTATALASAGAQNLARQRVESEGMRLASDVSNMGRGLPSQSAAGAGLSLNAGGAAMNTQLAAAGNARANYGMMSSAYGGAMQGNTSAANILNTQRAQDINAWGQEQQAEAQGIGGIAQGVGTMAGLYLASSKDKKTDKEPAGKALPAVNGMDIDEWTYKPGEGDGGRHIGPYAEDFKRETGIGDGKNIDVASAIGVTMKAVQELDEKVEKMGGSTKGKKRKKRASEKGLRGVA